MSSKYNRFLRNLDRIAHESFANYRKFETAFKEADDARSKFPWRDNADPAYTARSAQAKADFESAKTDFYHAKMALQDSTRQFEQLRKELEKELAYDNAVDSSALDSNVLAILKSGICGKDDFSRLLHDFEGNQTMTRLICKSCADAAAKRVEKFGENDAEARELRLMSYAGKENSGADVLQSFDAMTDIFNRATKNPLMIDHWKELTAPILESFADGEGGEGE